MTVTMRRRRRRRRRRSSSSSSSIIVEIAWRISKQKVTSAPRSRQTGVF